MHATARAELTVVDADLAHQALEDVAPARRHRDLREVVDPVRAFVLLPWQARDRLEAVRVLLADGVVDASGDVGDDDLATELAGLHHERNVRADRHVSDRERTLRVALHGAREWGAGSRRL